MLQARHAVGTLNARSPVTGEGVPDVTGRIDGGGWVGNQPPMKLFGNFAVTAWVWRPLYDLYVAPHKSSLTFDLLLRYVQK